MPFAKGQPRPAGAGRKKGSLTKLSKEVASRLEALGCDPIEGMARIAKNNRVDIGIRMRCFAELAQYVYPKRRAVEFSGLNGDPIEFRNADSAKRALEDRISGVSERIRPNGAAH